MYSTVLLILTSGNIAILHRKIKQSSTEKIQYLFVNLQHHKCIKFVLMKKWMMLLVMVMVLIGISYGQGCSQCKLLTEQGSELDENSFGSNINSGILYLMAIPYLLIFFLLRKRIFAFFKGSKK
jgi:hypothetical protein